MKTLKLLILVFFVSSLYGGEIKKAPPLYGLYTFGGEFEKNIKLIK